MSEEYEVVNETESVDLVLNVTTLPAFEDNREKWLKSLDSTLNEFKGITLTDETLAKGKKTVANLRKMKTLISSRRIAIKKEILQPYEEIEKFCKEADAKIDTVIQPIQSQLDDFEFQRKQEKIEKIKEIHKGVYEAFCLQADSRMKEFVQYCLKQRKMPEEWQNSSYSLSKIKSEYEQLYDKYINDFNAFDTIGKDYDISELMVEYAVCQDVSQSMLAVKQRQEKKAEVNKVIQTENITPVVETPTLGEPNKNEAEKKVIKFWVECTREELQDLDYYLNRHEIPHGMVK